MPGRKPETFRYCGREFTRKEIRWIRELIGRNRRIHRTAISRRFCRKFGWKKPDGGLKDMSCRVAMLRMERDGLLELPPRQGQHHKPRKRVDPTPSSLPRPAIRRKAGEFSLRFELVTQHTSALWNELIGQYHYLGYTPLPGAQLRYFIASGDETLALLGFGAAAWSVQTRDEYIGWDMKKRKENLHLVVNNARFLVLPWVESKNLCSRILSLVSKRLPADWENRYHYRPVLLETFVDKERHSGTCYKASGWVCVGETKGRGKLDVHREYRVSRKTVWVRPLVRDYRRYLLGGQG